MFLLLHILIALSSIGYTTYLFFFPSTKHGFQIAEGLVALTLISGTYLVITTSASLAASCETGLVYLLGVSGALVFAHKKLANVPTD